MSLKSLERNIQKVSDRVAEQMAYEIGFKIEEAYERIIDKFYNDYTPNNGNPWYYNRTFSLYRASSAYDDYSRLIVSKNKQKSHIAYRVGISVSSDNILNNPYTDDKEWVFLRAFKEGVHGFSEDDLGSKKFQNIPPKTTPSPKQQMDEWFAEFKNNNDNIKKIYSEIFKEELRKELKKGGTPK